MHSHFRYFFTGIASRVCIKTSFLHLLQWSLHRRTTAAGVPCLQVKHAIFRAVTHGAAARVAASVRRVLHSRRGSASSAAATGSLCRLIESARCQSGKVNHSCKTTAPPVFGRLVMCSDYLRSASLITLSVAMGRTWSSFIRCTIELLEVRCPQRVHRSRRFHTMTSIPSDGSHCQWHGSVQTPSPFTCASQTVPSFRITTDCMQLGCHAPCRLT